MRLTGWVLSRPEAPMSRLTREETAGPGEVLVAVAGCGVCHTDLGFFSGSVKTRRPLPLTLGHEISGTVVEAGPGAEEWQGQRVVVPAVLPCGECTACQAGRGQVCPKQTFPGNDVHGGFATHVRLPARGLCRLPDARPGTSMPDLATLSVIADAVSTPYQAILRSGLGPGDLAVFVGVGGVGGFGVQIASAFGARVVAIDVNEDRLAAMAAHGAALTLDARGADAKELRRKVRELGDAHGIPTWRTRVYETSGTPAGQATAFGLLGPGSLLTIVGFTPNTVELRLSNLMAFDATVMGNWGCLPEHYPAVVDLVLAGKVALAPFVEKRPLSEIDQVFAELSAGRATRRMVLVPEE